MFAGAYLLASFPAHAGRPLSTEDAGVIDEARCQVETWVDLPRAGAEAWFVPACNFGHGIEWQVGFARAKANGEPSYFSAGYAQAKFLLPGSGEDAGWGGVVGVTKFSDLPSHRGWENPYALIMGSTKLGDDFLHGAIGWSQERSSRRNATTWGVAYEKPITERVTLLGEAFSENLQKPYLRFGMRWELVEDSWAIDVSYVTRPGGTKDERLWSIGLFWQSAK